MDKRARDKIDLQSQVGTYWIRARAVVCEGADGQNCHPSAVILRTYHTYLAVKKPHTKMVK